MNEDRRRFLTALGVAYCHGGNHAASGYTYDWGGKTWCYQHPAPAGDQYGPTPGYCNVHKARIHFAREGVYWWRDKQVFVCPKHLAAIVGEVIRRGEYGR